MHALRWELTLWILLETLIGCAARVYHHLFPVLPYVGEMSASSLLHTTSRRVSVQGIAPNE